MKMETETQHKPEKPVEEQPAPKKKKLIKKVQIDDQIDYIKKLMDMEIPKTELELFEKPEFEDIKRKQKSLVPTTEKDKRSELIFRELPEEVVSIQVPTETGEVVEQKVTTRKIKKKQGDEKQVFEVNTVEEEGKEPAMEIIIKEVQPSEEEEKPKKEPLPIPESDKPEKTMAIDEVQPMEMKTVELPKLKKKVKVIKKPRKDDRDDHIQKLIDQEIPKTQLEVFEKPDFDQVSKTPKKKLLLPETSEGQVAPAEYLVDELPEETAQIQLPKKDIIQQQSEDEAQEEIVIVPLIKKEQTTEQIIKKERRPKQKDCEVQIELKKNPEINEATEKVETKESENWPIAESPVDKNAEVQPAESLEEVVDLTESEKAEQFSEIEMDEKVTPGRKLSVSKPKKKIELKKTSNLDEDYIQKLLEQEIPRNKLEKFEKPEFEKTQKEPLDRDELVQTKIEHKEPKPTELKIVSIGDSRPVKLKPKKPKHIEPNFEEKSVKPRLKSCITYIDIEKPMNMKITDIGALKDNGELSRNILDAEKVLKTKEKKFKHKPKRKDSLEEYEEYEISFDESTKKEPYRRTKTEKPDEPTDTKTLKLGEWCDIYIILYFPAIHSIIH